MGGGACCNAACHQTATVMLWIHIIIYNPWVRLLLQRSRISPQFKTFMWRKHFWTVFGACVRKTLVWTDGRKDQDTSFSILKGTHLWNMCDATVIILYVSHAVCSVGCVTWNSTLTLFVQRKITLQQLVSHFTAWDPEILLFGAQDRLQLLWVSWRLDPLPELCFSFFYSSKVMLSPFPCKFFDIVKQNKQIVILVSEVATVIACSHKLCCCF